MHISPDDPQFLWHAFQRLLLAAALGAMVGLEREVKHRPAGLRTITLITVGSAMFTILSEALSSILGGEPLRIASQLIPGIGFLGAGAILHSRGAVLGLTTAATIFVMASVGMASGGGLFLLATGATLMMLTFLVVIGWVERQTALKFHALSFQLSTRQPERCLSDLREVARQKGVTMRDFRVGQAGERWVVEMVVETPMGREGEVLQRLQDIQQAHA